MSEKNNNRFKSTKKQNNNKFQSTDKTDRNRFQSADKTDRNRFQSTDKTERNRFQSTDKTERNRFQSTDKTERNRFQSTDKTDRNRFQSTDKTERNRFQSTDKTDRNRFQSTDKTERNRFQSTDKTDRNRFQSTDKTDRNRFQSADKTDRNRFQSADKTDRNRFQSTDKTERNRFQSTDKTERNRFQSTDKTDRKRFQSTDETDRNRFQSTDKTERNRFQSTDKTERNRFQSTDKTERNRFQSTDKTDRNRFQSTDKTDRKRFQSTDKTDRNRFQSTDKTERNRFQSTDKKQSPRFLERQNKTNKTENRDRGPSFEKRFSPPIKNFQKPQLLAPAGSKAAWAAAVMAGADAVYLGFNDFSARSYAENFSVADLYAVVKESHQANVKVHLAFNSLIKESELPQAYKLLAAAEEFKVDALIVQDLGIAYLVKKHFPQLTLHASTLIGTYDLDNLYTLKNFGFKRAVLARELSYNELVGLSHNSPLETEIFIHGALCYSFSGLCFMSSFLGGKSALRGSCTQPCRRSYQSGRQRGAFFSTSDLSAALYIKRLKELPITSYKIEGRMKGADYVERVVKAYRLLIDAPIEGSLEVLEKAQSILNQVPSRRLSLGALDGGTEILSTGGAKNTTSGLLVGYGESNLNGSEFRVKTKIDLQTGDRLRLVPQVSIAGDAFNLQKFSVNNTNQEQESAQSGDFLIITLERKFLGTAALYKVSSGSEEKEALNTALVKNVNKLSKDFKALAEKKLPLILKNNYQKKSNTEVRRLDLWFIVGRAEEALNVAKYQAKMLVLPLTAANAREVNRNKKSWTPWLNKLVWQLPPLMFFHEAGKIKQELAYLVNHGAKRFMISSLGHLNLLKKLGSNLEIWGDYRLGVLNHLHELNLKEAGLSGTTFSLEAEEKTLKDIWTKSTPGHRLLYMYGHPALFTSRFTPKNLKTRIPLLSPRKEKFSLSHEHNALTVKSMLPVFMGALLKFPPLAGGKGLIIDLTASRQVEKTARQVSTAISSGRSLGSTSAFNYKRNLS